MKRVQALMFMMAIVALASYPAAEGSAYCETTCPSGIVLKCCLASGTCTSSSDSVNCNGTVLTCAAADERHACLQACQDQLFLCRIECPSLDDRVCQRACTDAYRDCQWSCPPGPTSIGC
jgi:hypothetical protein